VFKDMLLAAHDAWIAADDVKRNYLLPTRPTCYDDDDDVPLISVATRNRVFLYTVDS